MTTITREQFIEAMHKAVAERGEDFVYPDEWRESASCLYYIESPMGVREGACIVGKAIEIATGGEVYTGYNAAAYEVLSEEYDLAGDVGDAAFVAQRVQDTGGTWGEALAAFEEYLAAKPFEQNVIRARAVARV